MSLSQLPLQVAGSFFFPSQDMSNFDERQKPLYPHFTSRTLSLKIHPYYKNETTHIIVFLPQSVFKKVKIDNYKMKIYSFNVIMIIIINKKFKYKSRRFEYEENFFGCIHLGSDDVCQCMRK